MLAPNSEENDEARWPDQLPRLVVFVPPMFAVDGLGLRVNIRTV